MAATAAEIIASSMRKLGIIASGEDPSAAEQADVFTALKNMIEGFSNESLMIFSDNEETFALTPSQSSYTMGSGGDFNTVKPLKITHARLKVTTTTPAYELPVSILELDEWTRIVQKNVSSSISTAIYLDYGAALVTVNIYPVPTLANSIILNSMKVIQALSVVADSIALPPGYERMLIYNLAEEIAPEFGMEPSPTVMRIARESKAQVKRINKKMPISTNGVANLINGSPFNWLTGE